MRGKRGGRRGRRRRTIRGMMMGLQAVIVTAVICV